jgi:hypothetical protein
MWLMSELFHLSVIVRLPWSAFDIERPINVIAGAVVIPSCN